MKNQKHLCNKICYVKIEKQYNIMIGLKRVEVKIEFFSISFIYEDMKRVFNLKIL